MVEEADCRVWCGSGASSWFSILFSSRYRSQLVQLVWPARSARIRAAVVGGRRGTAFSDRARRSPPPDRCG